MNDYLKTTYQIRKKRVLELMMKHKIRSYRKIDIKCGFSEAKLASLMREENNITEKFARIIEEKFSLNRLWLDQYDQKIVENNGYTLESYSLEKSVFSIKNIDIPHDYFYIEVTENCIYEKGTLILFKPIKSINKLKSDHVYLIKNNDSYIITKCEDYKLISSTEIFDIDEVQIIAEKRKIEI